MRLFACILGGCLVAISVSAVEVQVFAKAYATKPREEVANTQPTETPARALPVTPATRATAPVISSSPASKPASFSPAVADQSRALPVRGVPSEAAAPASSSSPAKEFTYQDRSGKVTAAPIVDRYQKRRIVYPLAKIDPRLNPKLMRAASIAQERARAHSKSRCWRYVKNALLASGIISSYPKTPYAKQAGDELVRDYGFKKLPIRDPYAAPVGAILVYGSRRAAGHVEIRTKTGFVSDFQNKKPSPRPLLGIYAKA